MANLDLTTFTEVDSASDITVTSAQAAFDTMQRDAVSYVYDDLGAGYFTDFHFEFEVKIDSVSGNTGHVVLAGISNTVGTIEDMIVANDGIEFSAYADSGSLRFDLDCRSTDNNDSYVDGGTSSNILYCIFERVGTTTTVKIYSDASHSTLVDTLSITSESGSKQYLYALASRDESTGATDSLTGYTQNFNIDVEFASTADIVSAIVSDANTEREFTSTANIVSAITDPAIQIIRDFTSTANIVSAITDPVFNREWHIEADGEIFSDISSNIFQEREFTSTADIVLVISDPVFERDWSFASQADIVSNITDLAHNIEREFASTADIISDISDPEFKVRLNFKSQPIVGFDVSSSIFALKEFTSTADIVSAITDPVIAQGGMFSVTAGITHNTRSDIRNNNLFRSQADIVSDISDPGHNIERELNSQADIVFDLVSDTGGTRRFTVYPTIPLDISSGGIKKSNLITSQPSVSHSITSDIFIERLFTSQADISADISALARVEREFAAIAELIVFDVQRPKIFRSVEFRSLPSIAWSVITDINAEREFASTVDIVFDLSSAGGNAERDFASTAGLVLDIVSDANAERVIASQADIVSDITDSAINRKREFVVGSSITWGVSSKVRRLFRFGVVPTIDFITSNVNIFKTNYFSSLSDITFDIVDAGIFVNRDFTVGSDIIWNISELTPIYVTRNLASTVNIIINVESLNILNTSIDDLFPCTIRSLTPKRTAILI